MNTVEFLKNYNNFAYKVRQQTAKTLLERLQQSSNEDERRVMMLRIVEELIASTEDLAMWYLVIKRRSNPPPGIRDVWEQLLDPRFDIGENEVKEISNDIGRLRKGASVLRKLNLTTFDELLPVSNLDDQALRGVLDSLLKTLKAAVRNRLIKRNLLCKFQNKIKHGMVVLNMENSLYVRTLDVKKIAGGRIRVYRRNRNANLRIDVGRAERIVGTIKANSLAIKTLIALVLFDYKMGVQERRIKLPRGTREFWLRELEDVAFI